MQACIYIYERQISKSDKSGTDVIWEVEKKEGDQRITEVRITRDAEKNNEKLDINV